MALRLEDKQKLVAEVSEVAASAESAIAFAWIWLAMLLGQGVVGGIVFLFRKNRPSADRVQDLMEKV